MPIQAREAGPDAATGSDAAAWVGMFAEGWTNPVDPDTFCDHFEPWLDPEVRMIQPQLPPVVGLRGFREEFARPLFELVPDLRGTVVNWSATGDVIHIELRLEGTVGATRSSSPAAIGSHSATARRSSASPTSTPPRWSRP